MIKAKFKEFEFLWEESKEGISKEEFFKFLESFGESFDIEEVKVEPLPTIEEVQKKREEVVSKLKSLSAKDYSTVKGLSKVVSELIKLL